MLQTHFGSLFLGGLERLSLLLKSPLRGEPSSARAWPEFVHTFSSLAAMLYLFVFTFMACACFFKMCNSFREDEIESVNIFVIYSSNGHSNDEAY